MSRKRLKTNRRKHHAGSAMAELAAAMTLVIPIFIVVVYLSYEAMLYMYLKTGVDAAARTQARWLAINFNYFCQQNGNSAANYSKWKNSQIRVARCVSSNTQFVNGTINNAGNFVATPPALLSAGGCAPGLAGQGTVAVQVIYPGASGLPAWPNPPLKFFGVSLVPSNMTIAAVYVADIEP